MSERNEVEDEMDLEQYEGHMGNSWFWGDYTSNGEGVQLNSSKILPNGKEEVIAIANIEIQFVELGPDGFMETGPTHKLIRDAPDLLAALKQERTRHLETLIYQSGKYMAFKHWLLDNHPEVAKAYLEVFYSNDIALTGCASESEYIGCEGYPDYDRRGEYNDENDPNECGRRGWCECGI